jgi:hypothetical protein
VRRDAPHPFRARLTAWQLLLPGTAAFSGLTAAQVRGWALPPLPAGLPVFAAMDYGRTAPVRPGAIKVTRHRQVPPAELVHGLRVTTPAETILTCAAYLSVLDLVVIIGSALRAKEIELIELWMTTPEHRRGIGRLRLAMALIDPMAESVMEDLLRVLHVVCGIDVVSQFELCDADGNFVARGELLLVGTQTFQEYDGQHHAEVEQHRQDRVRDRAINSVGWLRNGYTDRDLFSRPVGILADADRSIGRTHDPRRIRAWWRLFRESLFASSGRAALLEHVAPEIQKRRVA